VQASPRYLVANNFAGASKETLDKMKRG
jgi:hypothetical protein